MQFSPNQVRIVADGLDHPEGVAVGPDGVVYAGGERGQVYRIEDGTAAAFAETGGFVLGLTVDASSTVFLCDAGRAEVIKVTPDGSVVVLASGTGSGPFTYPNFPVLDRDGTLFVSDSGRYGHVEGRIVAISSDGTAEDLTPPLLHYPNGLALHDGWLYVAESTAAAVVRFPVLPGAGLGPAELYVRLPESVPDGLAFGASGTLYVGCYRPDVIFAVGPDRVPRVLVADPMGDRLNVPTNVALTDSGDLLFSNLGGYHIGALEVADPPAPATVPA